MFRMHIAHLLLVTLGLLALSRPACAQVTLRFKSLDFSGAGFPGGCSAWGVNIWGTVVGDYGFNNVAELRGFVYQKGAFTDVVVPGAGGQPNPPLGVNILGELNGINDFGVQVGDCNDAQGLQHGFLRRPDGSLALLPDLPVTAYIMFESYRSINDAGDIAGYYSTDPDPYNDFGASHGFIFHNGVYTTVDYPRAHGTLLKAINNVGQALGQWLDASGKWHGFLRTNGHYTPVNVPIAGPLGTAPEGMNDVGQVVGTYWDAQSVEHGFLLSDGVYNLFDFPGSTTSDATSINNFGEIAGAYDGFLYGYIARIVP